MDGTRRGNGGEETTVAPGASSHQLRSEINRRQMRRVPTGHPRCDPGSSDTPRAPPADNTTVFDKYKNDIRRLATPRPFDPLCPPLRPFGGSWSQRIPMFGPNTLLMDVNHRRIDCIRFSFASFIIIKESNKLSYSI